MRVDQLMTKQVSSCGPGDTLAQAARLMWETDCGCLPVCNADGVNRVIGVITDRDICMSALFTGRPLQELQVADAMSRQLNVCRPGDSLDDVERAMRLSQIRRLPVVDDDGGLVGMITLADLARQAASDSHLQKHEITESEVGDTLAMICRVSGEQRAA